MVFQCVWTLPKVSGVGVIPHAQNQITQQPKRKVKKMEEKIPDGYSVYDRERHGSDMVALKESGRLDELCTCCHLRSQHGDTCGGLAEGHGSCNECDCQKYTWKEFLVKDE